MKTIPTGSREISGAATSALPSLRPHLPLVLALALATGAEAFTSSAVGIALPRIAAGFAASPDEISWAVTLYLASYAVFLPLTAWFSDVLGQRRYVGFSMLAYLLTSVGCMASPTLPVFLAMRVLQGAAGAAFLARAIFTFTKELRPPVLWKAFYIFIGAFSLRAFGLPLGGYLVDNLSWRALFALPAIVIGCGALPALFYSTEIWPRRRRTAPDLIGLALLAGGLGALLVLLMRGQRDDWLGSPAIVALLTTVLLAVPLFFWRQHRPGNDRRLITIASLRYRGMGVGVTLSFLAGVMMIGGVYVLPQFLLRVVGCDAYRTGWLMSIDAFAMMAGLAFTVWTLGRILTRSLLTLAGMLFSASMMLLAFRITSATPVEALYLPMALHGLGIGLALPPIGIFSFRAIGANQHHNSEGRAWHYTARQLGSAVAIAGVVMILDTRTTIHSSQLAENLTGVSPLVRQTLIAIGRGLASHGLPPAFAPQAATAVLGRIVARESAVLAFHDLFLLTTVVGVVVSVLSLGLPRLRRARAAVAPRSASPSSQ